MQLVSVLFYISPILGLLAVVGIFWFINQRRKSIYNQYYQNSGYRTNRNTYENTNTSDSYSNDTYDTNYSQSSSTNSKDVFEAEYTEQDIHVH